MLYYTTPNGVVTSITRVGQYMVMISYCIYVWMSMYILTLA